MALKISNECIACDACREECIPEAIMEGEPIYVIDPERCTECIDDYDEPACVLICPIDCIELDNNNIDTLSELQYKSQKLKN